MILPPEVIPLLSALAPAFTRPTYRRFVAILLVAVLTTGHRLDLVRYSGSQRREWELRGVSSTLDLPCGTARWPPLRGPTSATPPLWARAVDHHSPARGVEGSGTSSRRG
jgi:hypothetical protein